MLQLQVWLGIVVSIGVGTVILGLIKKFQNTYLSLGRTEGVTELSWMFFRVYANRMRISNERNTFNIFFSSFILITLQLIQF